MILIYQCDFHWAHCVARVGVRRRRQGVRGHGVGGRVCVLQRLKAFKKDWLPGFRIVPYDATKESNIWKLSPVSASEKTDVN